MRYEHDDGLTASRLKHLLTFRIFFVASTGIKLSILSRNHRNGIVRDNEKFHV